MRISDWSSDVCSSDLQARTATRKMGMQSPAVKMGLSIAVATGLYGVASPPSCQAGMLLPPEPARYCHDIVRPQRNRTAGPGPPPGADPPQQHPPGPQAGAVRRSEPPPPEDGQHGRPGP